MMPAPHREQGFTLVELVVALALFALISVAGVRLIDMVLRVERASNGRLEALADLQRAMYIISADIEQIDGDMVINGSQLRFARMTPGGDRTIEYRVQAGHFERLLDGQARILVSDVQDIGWRFHKIGVGWATQPASQADPSRPDGVELRLTLAGRDGASRGMVRRLISLPREPEAWP